MNCNDVVRLDRFTREKYKPRPSEQHWAFYVGVCALTGAAPEQDIDVDDLHRFYTGTAFGVGDVEEDWSAICKSDSSVDVDGGDSESEAILAQALAMSMKMSEAED